MPPRWTCRQDIWTANAPCWPNLQCQQTVWTDVWTWFTNLPVYGKLTWNQSKKTLIETWKWAILNAVCTRLVSDELTRKNLIYCVFPSHIIEKQFFKSAKMINALCSIYLPQKQCKRLWCTSAEGDHKGCRTQHMPLADGTDCGHGMVSHHTCIFDINKISAAGLICVSRLMVYILSQHSSRHLTSHHWSKFSYKIITIVRTKCKN